MHAEAKTVAKIDSTRDILLVWSQQQPIPILSGVPEEPEVPTDNAR